MPRLTGTEEELREGSRSIMHFKLSPNKHPLEVSKLNVQEKVGR